ncbi:unnamed protein product [Oikopleura dioica]|uniref:Bestrophin homolog n=1 Tax=Oikopleura dioica TaxID=34765 RepID=E4YHW5_OIKDI|nr:unnamed protein product [Oikopleura dioica]
MTITYSQEVAEVKFMGFGKLLFKWKGSVYKLFWRELITWLVIYVVIAMLNRMGKGSNVAIWPFEDFCVEVNEFSNYVPLSFILGFFVSVLIGRWWNQYLNIPWPDRNMLFISLYLRHHVEDKGNYYRRKLVRWLNLAAILTFRDVAASVKRRFPTMEHVSSAGFMTESERETYESIETTQLKYWIPFTWYINTLNRARKQGLIASDITLDRLVNEMNAYRGNCGMLQSYDWICIPLVYTQVVCVAVYGYFALALFGRQRILGEAECSSQLESNTSMVSDSDEHFFRILPIHTLLEFFFYMGWMKVAEQLINPFGMDDEDYEVNMIIDRNLEVSFLGVDTLHDEGPADADDEDIWVGKTFAEAPYTEDALEHKKEPFLGIFEIENLYVVLLTIISKVQQRILVSGQMLTLCPWSPSLTCTPKMARL